MSEHSTACTSADGSSGGRSGLRAMIVLTALALIVTGLRPQDRVTWLLEVLPVLIALPILVMTHGRLPLTTLLYGLLFLHGMILMVGGHYTYAEVPLGFWAQDWMGWSRNHYDRLGHLAQGFVPAILARELLLRRSPLVPGKWLFVIVVSICLAFSASYEIIEWLTALAFGEAAEAFLGTQGDAWDTQWDMFCALVGAVAAQVLLSRVHDRGIARLGG